MLGYNKTSGLGINYQVVVSKHTKVLTDSVSGQTPDTLTTHVRKVVVTDYFQLLKDQNLTYIA